MSTEDANDGTSLKNRKTRASQAAAPTCTARAEQANSTVPEATAIQAVFVLGNRAGRLGRHHDAGRDGWGVIQEVERNTRSTAPPTTDPTAPPAREPTSASAG